MQLADTHCHIHSADYPLPLADVAARATKGGVDYLICVGTDAVDSELAVAFVQNRDRCWASVGQHPHEARHGVGPLRRLRALLEAEAVLSRRPRVASSGAAPAFLDVPIQKRRGGLDDEARGTASESVLSLVPARQPSQVLAKAARQRTLPSGATQHQSQDDSAREGGEPLPVDAGRKIVAVGECGLDYFYGHSSKEDQEKALRYQIELALEFDLPLIFHVRDAFDDFWPIFDSYQGLRGVLHSFTDNLANLDKASARGLYIGVNGIMTFTKNDWQLEVARNIPSKNLLLETDAPFLTPAPNRGKVNEPANVMLTARFMSELRHVSVEEIADLTTANARQLFSL